MQENKHLYCLIGTTLLLGLLIFLYKVIFLHASIDGLNHHNVPLSLTQLPVNWQMMFRMLLAVPLGALIILFFRNYIGTPTFGVFLPVLIALAFQQMHFLTGIILYLVTIGFALLARFYFEKMQLLIIPRLSAVMIVSILFLTVFGLSAHYYSLQTATTLGMFPLAILLMTIEKMCDLWEDFGAFEAYKTGFGSLFIASILYVVMSQPWLQNLLFLFPELNLIVFAMVLLLGQYRGYRLTELRRFHTLCKQQTR